MATENAPEFNQEIINQALQAAHTHSEALRASASKGAAAERRLEDGALTLGAQCISVTVRNGQACLNLPLGIGHVCLPIPSWVPNGTAVQACLAICTKWGIPCGVEVTVSLAGQLIVRKNFGCSC